MIGSLWIKLYLNEFIINSIEDTLVKNYLKVSFACIICYIFSPQNTQSYAKA